MHAIVFACTQAYLHAHSRIRRECCTSQARQQKGAAEPDRRSWSAGAASCWCDQAAATLHSSYCHLPPPDILHRQTVTNTHTLKQLRDASGTGRTRTGQNTCPSIWARKWMPAGALLVSWQARVHPPRQPSVQPPTLLPPHISCCQAQLPRSQHKPNAQHAPPEHLLLTFCSMADPAKV